MLEAEFLLLEWQALVQIVVLQGALLRVTSYAMAAWMWQQFNTCKGHQVASATPLWNGTENEWMNGES